MAEYIVRCGNYRHFVVDANSPDQARERFDKVSRTAYGEMHITKGFTVKDITAIEVKK